MVRIAMVGAVLAGLYVLLSRGGELFCVAVRGGRVKVVRGSVPAQLLSDFADVVGSPTVDGATIKAYKYGDGARLRISGRISDGQSQRLRNVFGLSTTSQMH